MPATAGRSSERKLFGVIDAEGPLSAGRLLFLVSLGVIIVGLEQAFRWPLQLPGHHGLEAMALLVIGRLCCNARWSATTVGLSAAVVAPFLGADHGPLMPLFYVIPALVIDFGYRLWPALRSSLLFLPVLAAVAYSGKPLLRVLANQLFDMQFGSLRAGPVYPILTHLLFGFLGGLAAVMVWRATQGLLKHGR
jgi:hypothetical protein